MKQIPLAIQPRDPLIVRDGRDFTAAPGAKVRGYAFPPPQVVAGAIRAQVGSARGYRPLSACNQSPTPEECRDDLEKKWIGLKSEVAIQGPLLYDPDRQELFFPAPLDALLFKKDENFQLYRLAPLAEAGENEVLHNLPPGLLAVQAPPGMPKDKPESMPKFWRQDVFLNWLLGKTEPFEPYEAKSQIGLESLPTDHRTHVKINPLTQTAEEHMLFETAGLTFVMPEANGLAKADPLALAVRVLAPGNNLPQSALEGIKPLGGERRLALWAVLEKDPLALAPDPELVAALKKTRRARLILLTPADFHTDQNPDPYLPPNRRFGPAKLRAAAVGRPETVSGWDLLKGRPKPSRRLAPAGSVYFLDLSEVPDLDTWIHTYWMKNLPEQPDQSRNDGYGLAVLGVWR